MRRRKKAEEEHENLERWLVSYADFITLLFAFFVVMYSISSINEGKYRVLSDSLNLAFSEPKNATNIFAINKELTSPDVVDLRGGKMRPEDLAQLENVTTQIEQVLAPYIQDELITIKREGAWVEVEMKSGLLFASGSADLSPQAIPMLDKLADIFRTASNMINVEGHTDNVPINTPVFPSNWELSVSRSASVVHQLMRAGVEPSRMAATGYGEYHPQADNGSETGRDKNRRVVLILQSQGLSRYKLPNDQAIVVKPPSADQKTPSP